MLLVMHDMQVLASSGDSGLGGDDLDQLLLHRLLDTQLATEAADAVRQAAAAPTALSAAVKTAKV